MGGAGGTANGLELVILGSAGWLPQTGEGRMTTSLALRTPAGLLLFDAGVGLARLREPRLARLLEGAAEVHLFLSHLHLDHTVGLTFLPALWRETPLTIHVPGERLTGFPATSVLDRLVGPPFFPRLIADFPMPVRVAEAAEGTVEAAGVRVSLREQRHPGGSFGFRVDDRFAFVTDTVYDEGTAVFARGVRLLVHEAWIRGEGDPASLQATLAAHTSAEGAARVARAAQVGELLLSHLTPLRDEAYHEEMLERARSIFPATNLCEDGLRRELA